MPGVGVLGEIGQDFAIGVDEFMKEIGPKSASIWSIAIRMKIFARHSDQAFQVEFIAIEKHVCHLLFFLPPVVLSDSDYAFWSYAIAHGFQFFMMVFAMASGTKPSFKIIIVFIICVAGGGFFLHRIDRSNQALFLCGILLTWVCFILDAKLWRMSEPGPRKLLRGRFSFLFPNQKPESKAYSQPDGASVR